MSLATLVAAGQRPAPRPRSDPDDGRAAADRAGSIFRVDRFEVPEAAREDLLAVVRRTHRLLDGLDGCLTNLVLERPGEGGGSTIETVVEWRDEAALAAARLAVTTMHRAAGIDLRALVERLGVGADFGLWRPLDPFEVIVP